MCGTRNYGQQGKIRMIINVPSHATITSHTSQRHTTIITEYILTHTATIELVSSTNYTCILLLISKTVYSFVAIVPQHLK
jgi:hypothetical protein